MSKDTHDLKRFLITATTNWCGMDQEYAALAEHESDLYDIAEQLAYDNFLSYGLWEDIAEEKGYDPSEMTDEDWDELQSSTDESDYYRCYIDEFDGTEEEWNDYAKNGVYDPKSYV